MKRKRDNGVKRRNQRDDVASKKKGGKRSGCAMVQMKSEKDGELEKAELRVEKRKGKGSEAKKQVRG